VLAADAERYPDVEPVSFARAYMVVSGVQEAIVRAIAQGDDLRDLADEIKGFMKAVLVAERAPAG
jgi:hypothetical protein